MVMRLLPSHAGSPAPAVERFDAKCIERLKQIADDFAPAPSPTRRETTPECPPCPLQDALTGHVVRPLARTVKAVPVAFNGETAAFTSFNDKIDPEASAARETSEFLLPIFNRYKFRTIRRATNSVTRRRLER
jgi:hypothetical protein